MKITCGNCGANLQAKDELAGKKAIRPKCGVVIDVPAKSTEPRKRQIPLATERQKEYARELGIDFPPDINRREISDLIDEAVEQRDDERFERLNELSNRESEAWQQMREAVLKELDEEDCRLSTAQPQQIVDELADRGIGAILISFNIDDIDKIINDVPGVNFTVSFADIMSESEMRAALKIIRLIVCYGDDVT